MYCDVEDLALAVAAGLLAGALWELFVEQPRREPARKSGRYFPGEAIEQADRSRLRPGGRHRDDQFRLESKGI